MRERAVLAVVAGVAVLGAACGVGGGGPAGGAGSGGKGEGTKAASATPEPTSCPNGGQLIKGVDIPPVHADATVVREKTVAGEKIPGFTVPAVDIPGHHVPAQCVDLKPAPGGCLGAVAIPGSSIPGARIPGYEIPGIDQGPFKTEPVRVNPVAVDAVSVAAVYVGEECQERPPKEGGYVPSVYRPSAYRPSLYRPSAYRPSGYRPSVCNDNSECVPPVSVPSLSVPAVSIDAVSVDAAQIESRTVGRSKVLEGGGSIAYNIEADVLFDFGKSAIKPEAAAELQKVAESIKREATDGARIQVDGHTDAKGEDALNQRLSQQRARAVVDWLATQGGIERSRLQDRGYGESKPVAPNARPDGSDDPQGRAKNRRVVISARKN